MSCFTQLYAPLKSMNITTFSSYPLICSYILIKFISAFIFFLKPIYPLDCKISVIYSKYVYINLSNTLTSMFDIPIGLISSACLASLSLFLKKGTNLIILFSSGILYFLIQSLYIFVIV